MLRIEFDCKTNYPKDPPWVNKMTFKLKDGKTIDVDRNTTIYAPNTGYTRDSNFYMEWREGYEWDGESENYNLTGTMLRYAEIVDIDIEDEAPEDYTFEVVLWDVYDSSLEEED